MTMNQRSTTRGLIITIVYIQNSLSELNTAENYLLQ